MSDRLATYKEYAEALTAILREKGEREAVMKVLHLPMQLPLLAIMLLMDITPEERESFAEALL